MKLHLPKVLLTSLIAAVAIGQTATAEWAYPNSHPGYTTGAWYYFDKDLGKDSNTSYTTDSENRLILNVTGDAATAEELRLCVDNVANGNRTIYQLNLSDNNKRFDVAQTTWNASFTYKSLIIENLNLGAQGTGSAAFNVTYGHTVALENVAGTLSSVSNVGDLTLGTETSTTKLSGSISNSGTLELKGNIELTGTSDLILDTTRSGEISYTAANGELGEDGYRTVTNAHYFLVENTAEALDAVDVSGASVTLSKGGSTPQTVSLINDATTGSVLLSVGDDMDLEWYYVTNAVNYGGEGEVNDARGFALNGGTLNLKSSLDSSVVTNGIKATSGTTSALNLADSDVVLNRDSLALEAGSTVNLQGRGTMLFNGAVLTASSTQGLSFGDGWNGVVELKNCTTQTFNFKNLGSNIKIDGVSGTVAQALNPTANIEIAEGGWHITAKSNSSSYWGNPNNFNVDVSGTGDLSIETTQDPSETQRYSFDLFLRGDTSNWSGNINIVDNGISDGSGAQKAQMPVKIAFNGGSAFAADGNSTITSSRSNSKVEVFVGKSGTTTQMNAAVVNAGNGTVTVVAEHDTVFNKSLDVTNLEVRANATATLKADSTADTVTIAANGALEFAGGTLNVTNSLTLDASAIKIAESLTKDATAKTLINLSGADSTLTVNGSWTGSTYTIDGTRYTTSLNNTGTSLLLEYDAVTSLDLVVATAELANGMLTLNVTEDLTGISSVNLTLSDAALAEIAGKFGTVELKLEGLNNTGDSVTSISFYNAYVGEANGTYRVEYIPEPATATLSLLALAGLAARRRRK